MPSDKRINSFGPLSKGLDFLKPSPGGLKSERVLWTMKRGFYAAAVEKAEDQRFPDGFFAHRKGAVIEFAAALSNPRDG